MLQALKEKLNMTYTENGAVTYASTMSDCLNLFSTIGVLRRAPDSEIKERFMRAYAENPDLAMKTVFYARDAREGLGERRVFRVIMEYVAERTPKSALKNMSYIAEYGRWDDVLALMGTRCEAQMLECIKDRLKRDLDAAENGGSVSLLAKWLPSVNASGKKTVEMAKAVAAGLGLSEWEYRKLLSKLRAAIVILENSLRRRDYSFDYSKQPSKAMLKYSKAFIRNDGARYGAYIEAVSEGKAAMHTGVLYPYEVIRPALGDGWMEYPVLDEAQRRALDVTWNALPDYTNGKNALVVVDGSGSMYANDGMPALVAQSLGLYFAERNEGPFKNHFITFSANPRLVMVKGADLYEKAIYCQSYNEVANTNIQKVFELVLETALEKGAAQEELPETLFIISDMEFDYCTVDASLTNFQYAKSLYEAHGYRLPVLVFWNVASRRMQVPVTMNEQGAVLVSGASPRVFQMALSDEIDPYKYMLSVLNTERYRIIEA